MEGGATDPLDILFNEDEETCSLDFDVPVDSLGNETGLDVVGDRMGIELLGGYCIGDFGVF
jgi:hypothetical protein